MLKCGGCGEIGENWQYASTDETHELTKGHGICHILTRCSFCHRSNSLEILTTTYAAYTIEKNEQFQTIVKFECRGLEPVGWRCVGVDSGTVFEDIDLIQMV